MNTTDIKLSDKQKEVLRLMREGESLLHNRYIGYSSVSFPNISSFANKNTVKSLERNGLIYFGEKISYSSYSYKLTELGKTIQL